MSNLNQRQFRQGRLFARPSDLMDEGIEFADQGTGTVDRLRQQNLAEAEVSGLAASIAQEGVREPVEVFARKGAPWLTEGHHRFFSAEAQGDQYIPVSYVGAKKQARLQQEVWG